VIETYLAVLG